MFDVKPKIGLSSTSLPNDVSERLHSEDDLHALLVTSPGSPTSDGNDPPGCVTEIPENVTSHQHAEQFDYALMHIDEYVDDALDIAVDAATAEMYVSDTPTKHTPTPPVACASYEVLIPDTPLAASPPALTNHVLNIQGKRSFAATNQERQADRMLRKSRRVMIPAQRGDSVTIPIPCVDRGRGDPRNLLGVVISHDEKDLYKLWVKGTVLKGSYSRNQCDVSEQSIVTLDDIDFENSMSIREAVISLSKLRGQGYTKCNCKTGVCRANRCLCYKSKIKCNSRCHNSLSCYNK